MSDRFRDNYFVFVRMALILVLSLYGVLNETAQSGVSFGILLLVSFYIGVMSAKELLVKQKVVLTCLGALILALLLYFGGMSFYLLIYSTAFEFISLFEGADFKWYLLPVAGCILSPDDSILLVFLVVLVMAVLYIQNNLVINGYKKRMQEDVYAEQSLKRDMRERETVAKAELKRSMLAAENQILEERASLSQTLHDKLGHNINGSVYQLEAVKLLMDKDPEKSKDMVQAVIDQLRTGMDEIRAILRKERPEKKELALLQLYKLCEDCNSKGVETEFNREGDISLVGDELWEVILDNAFEAVSNSMKYAGCRHIDINLVIMNRMVRCSIKDDGGGCRQIVDGMGISGMRQRVRAVNGTIGFETEAGFTVTMYLPIA